MCLLHLSIDSSVQLSAENPLRFVVKKIRAMLFNKKKQTCVNLCECLMLVQNKKERLINSTSLPQKFECCNLCRLIVSAVKISQCDFTLLS